MKQKSEKPRQGNVSKSRSQSGINSKTSQSNSLRSQVTANKAPCESHYFQIKPCNQNLELYYRQKLSFYFTHQLKETRPYPIILQEFIDVEYLPFFGSENQIQNFRKLKNKYRSSFYEQKSKASFDDAQKKDVTTAIPKHKYCQVCKYEFENYEKHIAENGHLRSLRESYGNDIIDEFVQDFTEKIEEQKTKSEVIYFNRFLSSLKETNSLFETELRCYAEELQIYEKLHKA